MRITSNYKRSWSLIENRTVIANQQEFINRYLYSAIDPITGDNFHLLGFNDVCCHYKKVSRSSCWPISRVSYL